MNQGPSRLAYVLLALMTVFSMGGPFALGKILNGGEKDGWPPDRAVEWVAAVVIFGGVIVLLLSILAYGYNFKRQIAKHAARVEPKPTEGEVRP